MRPYNVAAASGSPTVLVLDSRTLTSGSDDMAWRAGGGALSVVEQNRVDEQRFEWVQQRHTWQQRHNWKKP